VTLRSRIGKAAAVAATAGAIAGAALLLKDRKRRKKAKELADNAVRSGGRKAADATVRIVREVKRSRKKSAVRAVAGAAAGVAARAAGRAALVAIADATAKRRERPATGWPARSPRPARSELEVQAGTKLGPDGTPGPFGV
jgi:hypothetical protein